MKKRVGTIHLVVLATILVGGCQQTGTNSNAGDQAATTNIATEPPTTVDQKAVVNEIRDALAQHDKGMNEKNLDIIMSTFSTNPNTVVLGTGAEERWVGQQEIRAAYAEMIKDYDAGTLQASCDWKTGGADPSGRMAWLAAICTCKDSHEGKTRDYKLNVSGALEKQDGKWRFTVLHMSNAFLPPITK